MCPWSKFLVGNRLSLADIELVVDLVPAFCSDQILVLHHQVIKKFMSDSRNNRMLSAAVKHFAVETKFK